MEIIAQESVPFDCMLFDIQMPLMDGIQLCEHVRQQTGYRQTPILMLTAMSERKYVDRAFSAGATDYISKPFDILELQSRLSMAERLSAETEVTDDAARSLDALTAQLTSTPVVRLDRPINLVDIPSFLEFNAFQNYIHLMTGTSYYTSSVLALKVENVDEIFARCSVQEFIFAITDIAEAISDNIPKGESFFSYGGSGVFYCVFNRLKDQMPSDLQYLVESTVFDMGLVYGSGEPLEVFMMQGDITNPGMFAGTGNLKVLEQALASLNQKEEIRVSMD
jgi:CheY-like chemotaxis protein